MKVKMDECGEKNQPPLLPASADIEPQHPNKTVRRTVGKNGMTSPRKDFRSLCKDKARVFQLE